MSAPLTTAHNSQLTTPTSQLTTVGDTINQCTLSTPDDAPSKFNQPSFIVQTADGGAAAAVTDSLVSDAVGVDRARISNHSLDSSVLHLYDRSEGSDWASSLPDALFSLLRVSVYDSESTRTAYTNQSWPVSFYFAADDAAATEPLVPEVKPRQSAYSELHLADALDALQDAVVARFSEGSTEFPNATTLGNTTLDYLTTGTYDDWERVISLRNNQTFQVS